MKLIMLHQQRFLFNCKPDLNLTPPPKKFDHQNLTKITKTKSHDLPKSLITSDDNNSLSAPLAVGRRNDPPG